MVSLKIRCGEDIRRISVEKDITFRELVLQLRQIFRVEQNEELVVKYVDDEGDKVTLSSDVEFKEALQCCKEPIQLVVIKYASGTIAAPQPVLDNLDLSLSQLLHVEQNKVNEEKKRPDEAKKQEEELLRRAEEVARKQEEEMQRMREEEEQRRIQEERIMEEQRKRREAEELKRREEEMKRLELQRQMEERRFKEEEERRKREEERRRREEEELRMREEERKTKEEERRMKEEERRKREEEELRMREAEQRKKEEEEIRRKQEEQEMRRKKEEEERINRETKPKPVVSRVDAAWVEYKARNGRTVLLDLSSVACARFGVRTYQRVKTPAGAGTVIGVDQEHGFLWFQLDKDMKEGVSYWDDIHDHDSMICKGIVPTEETALQHSIPLPKASEAMINSIQNPSEKEMMLRAIQQSLIDQQQQEIKQYYASLEAAKKQQ